MNDILYFIIITSIIIVQLVILFSFSIKVAKAGKVKNNFHFRLNFRLESFPETFKCGTQTFCTSMFKVFKVKGNSMKDNKIYDGQYVFVLPFSSEQKESIVTFPVLVFKIVRFWNIFDCKFKLRKFVSYIDITDADFSSVNWREFYTKHKERINESVSIEEFITDCNNKASKIKDNCHKYILSETYDEKEHRYRYSIHSVDSVYGSVKFVIAA